METKGAQGNSLVVHANYRDERRAAGLELAPPHRSHAESAVRNLISRASRYLVWSEKLRCKAQGLKGFHFGGGYYGNDPAMLRLNDFKRGFGRQIVREYQCEQIVSLKRWVVLTTAAALKRARCAAAKLRLGLGWRQLKPAAVSAGAGP